MTDLIVGNIDRRTAVSNKGKLFVSESMPTPETAAYHTRRLQEEVMGV